MKHFAFLIALLSCFSIDAQVVDTANYSVPKAVEKRTPSDTNTLVASFGRKPITAIEVGEIHTTSEVAIYMKLIVDAEGNVLEISSMSKTTCTDPVLLQQVLDAMKKAKFNPKPGTPREVVFYTVKIDNK